ncbi:fe superoxide dismutase [Diplodia corticola]|uniref:Fe superoxide dismutase n=1 Tax=Diplodia corticola TaxID=236234 RepID=A0A1J9RRK1_9PEZI|nr:fe superoxide dismutase [Diplodia corticola]OJD31063.1 fe superoxide dismutase [Diplodia corticola]
MILARHLRPQQPLRAAQRLAARAHRRAVHGVPSLANFGERFAQNGVPELLSQTGFNTAWTVYQKLMVDGLNERIVGTPLEKHLVKDIVIKTAREPLLASTFNYASMAFNNHFFFGTIADKETPMPDELAESLTTSFSSVDIFKADFLATAEAMFGPGFVWLVWHRQMQNLNKGSWKILPTYLAGSPLSDAHYRQQPVDMNTQNHGSAGGLSGADYARQSQIQNSAGVMGPHSVAGQAARNRAPGGADVVPVLCVNTWEHVWVPDWGVESKRDFLEAWWRRINWETLEVPPDALGKSGQSARTMFANTFAR